MHVPDLVDRLWLVGIGVAVWLVSHELQSLSLKASAWLMRVAADGVDVRRREDRRRDWFAESESLGPVSRVNFAVGLWVSYRALPSLRRVLGELADPVQLSIKRGLDVVSCLPALPLIVILAALVKVTSHGPAFYRVLCVGRSHQPFYLLRLRTMHVRGGRLLHGEPEEPVLSRFGRLLRRYSLDELPQLLNVLRGEMSLVGPRPIPLSWRDVGNDTGAEAWCVDPRIRPGVTGQWQVLCAGDRCFGRRSDEDLSYARNWSLALDADILIRTVLAVWRPVRKLRT